MLLSAHYRQHTNNLFFSCVMVLPLLVVYEILLALTNNAQVGYRNAADVWLRHLFSFFNLNQQEVSFVFIGIVFVMIAASYRSGYKLRFKYVLNMLLEAVIYGILLGFVIDLMLRPIFMRLVDGDTGFVLNQLALSLGAGLFEEFVFRVVLYNMLFLFLMNLTKGRSFSYLAAIISASLLFSWVHYIGPLGDVFSWYTFTFRFMAGLAFTLLYFWRGFGVTVYTHAFYDVFVLIRLILA